MENPSTRLVSDRDIDSYAAYRAKLASITTPDDPAPLPFSAWFRSKYQQEPIDFRVSDDSN